MHRHVGMQPLSREHHVALVVCRRLRLAVEADDAHRRAQAACALLRDWDVAIVHHFDDEERLLVPLIPDAALRDTLLADHAALRQGVAEIRAAVGAPSPERLAGFAQRLHDHVRWEERTLFPAIESTARAERLEELAVQTAAADARVRATRERELR